LGFSLLKGMRRAFAAARHGLVEVKDGGGQHTGFADWVTCTCGIGAGRQDN